MNGPRPLVRRCFDCGVSFVVWKNDRLCRACEAEERERNRAKGISGKSRRPRSLAARFIPIAPAAPSLAMRLHGKRAAAHG